jgi:nucleotide-binding universal stress UspA family protein
MEDGMKNVLVLIRDDDGQEARLQAALDATRALSGHLTCVHVTELIPVGGGAFDMSAAAAVMAVAAEVESVNRAKIERRLAREDVPWDLVEVTGPMEAALLRFADLADLVVLNAEKAQRYQSPVSGLAERIAAKSRKPVLAVRNGDKGFDPSAPVLVAWDGSDPAAAALTAAVPLLALSERVTIFQAEDGHLEDDAEPAAEYLSRHGVHTEILRQEAPDVGSVGPLLLSKLESGRYGWAVIGAFSRSRLVEALFGGVTKTLLKESPVPLFIAH